MNGTQLAVLLIAVAVILTNINLWLVRRQQAHFMDLLDTAYGHIHRILKLQNDFCENFDDLLKLIKRGEDNEEN